MVSDKIIVVTFSMGPVL